MTRTEPCDRTGNSTLLDVEKLVRIEANAAEAIESVARDEVGGRLEFGFVHISEKCEAKRAAGLRRGVGASVAGDPGGELAGLIEDEWIVEQAQGLERSRGLSANRGPDRGVGAVKGVEERLAMRANDVPINGSSVGRGTFRQRFVDGNVAFDVVECAVARAARGLVQRAADKENRVADRLGGESVAIGTPEE